VANPALALALHAQPPEQLRVALHAPSIGLESLPGKRFVSGDPVQPEESLPREVQTHRLDREELVAALDHVVGRLIECERLNAPQPGPS